MSECPSEARPSVFDVRPNGSHSHVPLDMVARAAGRAVMRCREAGFSTISMRDDWTTIYGEDVVMAPEEDAELAEAA